MHMQATFTTLCKSGILGDEELADGLLITVRLSLIISKRLR
jgi:hypothetical protein